MKFTAPDGVNDVSIAGVNYRVKKGVVDVPAEFAPTLYSFGFGNVADASAAADTSTDTSTDQASS